MHPRKFKELIGKGMTSQRLADLVDRSKSVVDHWLSDPQSKSYKEPPRDVKDHLSLIYLTYNTLLSLRRFASKRTVRILNNILDEQLDNEE